MICVYATVTKKERWQIGQNNIWRAYGLHRRRHSGRAQTHAVSKKYGARSAVPANRYLLARNHIGGPGER